MPNRLNDDGSVTLDSPLQVAVNKTVHPQQLRQRRAMLKDQIARMQENLSKLREQLANVRAELRACLDAGAPSVPGDENEGGGGELP